MDSQSSPIDDAKVGDELLTKVAVSPTRTSYFPDQAVVLTTAGFIELVLLRQEVSIRTQQGRVKAVTDDAVQIEFQPHEVSFDLMDIAHVRLKQGAAFDMAITVLNQAILDGTIRREAVLKRLQSRPVDSK